MMADDSDILDIAIIGAGPGGLSAAHALTQQGFSVGIFEKAVSLRPIGAALGLGERGYAAVKEISQDLANQIYVQGTNPQQVLLMRPNEEILFSDEAPMAGTSFTWLGWYDLQTQLRKMLPDSVHLHLNHHLIDFTNNSVEEPVKLRFKNQSPRLAKMVVGADGYHSMVRQKTVGDGAPLYTGTMTWRGMIPRDEIETILPTIPFQEGAGFQMIVGNQKNFWIMDAGSNQVAWTGTALQSSPEKSESVVDTLVKTFEQWPAIVQKIIRSTNPSSIIETGVFDREPVSQWGDGQRVTLLGDAAHPIRPALGLGATLAFEDAVALAQLLDGVNPEQISAVQTALSQYEQDRITVTTPLQKQARQQGAASHATDRADRLKAGLEEALANRRQQ